MIFAHEPGAARALSASERAVWLLNQASSLNGVLVAHVRGDLDAGLLRRGLSHVQSRHPLLRVGVRARSSGPWFEPCGDEVPLRVVPRGDAASWRAVAEDELN